MKIAILGLILLTSAHTSFAQMSGSAGAYGEGVAGVNPAQNEAAKRAISAAEGKDEGSSTFIEASILMNRKADEYVAVFGVLREGTTPEEVTTKMNATLNSFQTVLSALGIAENETYVDFVAQNRIYAFRLEEKDDDKERIAREELAGFELAKNVSIHFKDTKMIDRLVEAAAAAQIYDLIKVDYLVKDRELIQAQLQAQTLALMSQKAARYQTQLGVKLLGPTQVVADKPSVYYPVQQYDSYTAQEAEKLSASYNRSDVIVQNARKSQTAFFNPLSGDGFDSVINPIVIEPVVQFTTYLKVKYEAPKRKK